MSERIYHLVEQGDWDACARAAVYRPASLASEGFIHFSTRQQVEASAARFYSDSESLLVIAVDAAALGEGLRYEEADGQSFPHLYGPLDLDAVLAVAAMQRDPLGRYRLPAAF